MWLKEFLLCFQHKESSLAFNSYSLLPTPPCFPIIGNNVIIMFIAVSTILWGNYSHINSQKVPAAAAAKSIQLCPTLCHPIDGSPRGSPVPGILQAGTPEWVAISFSNAWKWKLKVKTLSCIRLLETPWTAPHQAPPSMGFSRQEYRSRLPLPSLRKSLVKHKAK